MFQEILAENGTKFVIAAVVVLLGLLCLALVLWIIRGRPSSPFIRGGRNRTPRLAVLDAAAIDTRRRLVLIRRDDVEHLVMIGGPTDIVIESRIVAASAEQTASAEKPVQKVERAEPAPVAHQTTRTNDADSRATASATAAAVAVATPVERRPAAQDGVSGMAKVLYSGEDGPDTRQVPARTVTQPAAGVVQRPVATDQRPAERRAEDVLDMSRQRVLAAQPGAASTAGVQATNTTQQHSQVAQRPVTAVARPVAGVADNQVVVSEFEKLLEAEMVASTPVATPTRTVTQPSGGVVQTAAVAGQAQASAKSREETEAEMARLLGEIAANRKA